MTLSEQVERLRTNIRFYMVENNTEYKADMREKAGKELLVLTATLPARIAATERVVEAGKVLRACGRQKTVEARLAEIDFDSALAALDEMEGE